LSFPGRKAGSLAVVWLLLTAAGFAQLMRYDFTPGEVARPPVDWPAESRLSPQPDTLNLVMAIHPRCPCSQAGLDELLRMLPQCRQPVRVHLLVFKPLNATAGWEGRRASESANGIPGVSVETDLDGIEAERFGARTSGQVLLYGSDGLLLFNGGITSSRGAGEPNPALSALQARIDGETRDPVSTPVFGCSLRQASTQTPLTGVP
jgi:hypothetical protein